MTVNPKSDANEVDPGFGNMDVHEDISDVIWADIPVLIIFWLLLGIVMLQFFTRYVLNDSLGWTEEIARYLLIFLTFVGSITCVRKGAHIFLEFFYRYLPRVLVKPVAVSVELVSTAFYAFAGYLTIQLAQETSAQNMVSIDLPKGIIYWTVMVCFFLMALTAAYRAVLRVRASSDSIAEEMSHPSFS